MDNQLNELTQPPMAENVPTEVKIGGLYTSIPNDKVLPAFQAALNSVSYASKDANNPHFGKKYADLADCMKAIKPALGGNELSLSQPPTLATDMRSVTIDSIVFHSSGQYVRWVFVMPIEGQIKAHEVGKTVTYARRYSLSGLGIIAEDDDDGNSGSNVGQPPRQQVAPQRREPPPPPPPSPAKAAATKVKPEVEKPAETKTTPAAQTAEQGELLDSSAEGGELQGIIADICAKHQGVTPTQVERFMGNSRISEQPMDLQVRFMRKYSEDRNFSVVATNWARTKKTFLECFEEALAKGPDVWRESITTA